MMGLYTSLAHNSPPVMAGDDQPGRFSSGVFHDENTGLHYGNLLGVDGSSLTGFRVLVSTTRIEEEF